MEDTHKKKPHYNENNKTKNRRTAAENNTESYRKPAKKYHEDCYTDHKQTERRIRYHEENEPEKKISHRQSGDCDQSNDVNAVKIVLSKPENAKIKRKPRVEDVKGRAKDKRHACSKERNRKGCRKIERQHSEETNNGKTCDQVQRNETHEEKRLRRRPSHTHVTQKRMGKEKDNREYLRGRWKKDDYYNNPHRRCYSDSELEQTRSHVQMHQTDTKSRKADSAGDDVVEYYDRFYDEEKPPKGRKKVAESTARRETCKKSEKRRRSTTATKDQAHDNEEEEEVATNCDQSTIRGKLIRVLFKRVKDLLKETEKLRDERKEFTTQIEALSLQVQGLRMKEEEHVTSELKIKETLNAIGNDADVTSKGKRLLIFRIFCVL